MDAKRLRQLARDSARHSFRCACVRGGLPEPVPELLFHPVRKWRFDWAWPAVKVALEIQGGVWVSGRHSRGKGQIGDMAKLNEAQILGWIVLQATPQQVESGEALEVVRGAIAARGQSWQTNG